MSEIDQQFIEYVVKSLVNKPDEVKIDRRIDEKGVLLELTVDPEDLGRVIGKRGATAQSLRTLLRALGTKNDARYNLKIVDNGVSGGSLNRSRDDSSSDNGSADNQADNSSDDISGASKTELTEETPASDKAEEPTQTPEETKEEESSSDRFAKTRAELADLDDLDL